MTTTRKGNKAAKGLTILVLVQVKLYYCAGTRQTMYYCAGTRQTMYYCTGTRQTTTKGFTDKSGPDPGLFWRWYTDFGDIEFGRPQNKSRTKTKKGSPFKTESKISKVRELIPALTRLCVQHSQDPMIDSRHLWKYACKVS